MFFYGRKIQKSPAFSLSFEQRYHDMFLFPAKVFIMNLVLNAYKFDDN